MKHFYNDLKLGILGGGQLGRMLIQSAIDFNISIHVLDPDKNAPCKDICEKFELGSLTDFDAVYHFGKNVDLITIEIENVNADALEKLEKEGKMVYPSSQTIRLIQDKGSQKAFYKKYNIPTSDFHLIKDKSELGSHLDFLPAFQKLRTSGYDGKGVQHLANKDELDKAFNAPTVLEKRVEIEKEISIICARNAKGEIKIYPPIELVFDPIYNLVNYLLAPANIDEKIANEAISIAKKVVDNLKIVGLLAVEMFLSKDGKILVNEMAPRPHNSGHHTIEANVTSQFEQHLRAILDLPLGSTDTIMPAAMMNLLGSFGFKGPAKYEGIKEIMNIPGIHIHLYGKKETKPYRKMGHITITGNNQKEILPLMQKIKNIIKVVA